MWIDFPTGNQLLQTRKAQCEGQNFEEGEIWGRGEIKAEKEEKRGEYVIEYQKESGEDKKRKQEKKGKK
jgi:hypothetical protein